MSRGYVYILTNEAMPGLVKIGKTSRDVVGRANELYQTGVPLPFRVAHWCKTPDCDELETWVHDSLSQERVSPSREFFRCEAEYAVQVLHGLLAEQVAIWLEEFMPGFRAIHQDVMVPVADVLLLAEAIGEQPVITADALSNVTPDEIMPALERVLSRRPADLKVVQ
jgi:hypothetical protein